MLVGAQVQPAYTLRKLHRLRGRSQELCIKEGKKASQPQRQSEPMQNRFIKHSMVQRNTSFQHPFLPCPPLLRLRFIVIKFR